ncbi:Dom-3 Z [Apophysomyces ossiformis]|uniref:Decapping nuclease n=1 Tax=Apophysomyces ossiformis TaxID=679940 RepID=A0A8H7BN21_9FUNG|nr:Dom-3 Z [Apophysomyces ossiformis]
MSKTELACGITQQFESIQLNGDTKRWRYPVFSRDIYEGQILPYNEPCEITCFSSQNDKHVCFDDRELKYYYPPSETELSQGYVHHIKKNIFQEVHLDYLLDALTDLQSRSSDPNLTKADIVTWRGIISKIMCTPYQQGDPWEFRATRYDVKMKEKPKGTIYIEEQMTKSKRAFETNKSEHQSLMEYWGQKFESLATVSKPNPDKAELEQRAMKMVDASTMYCTVVKTKLGKTSLIMGAEIDCIEGTKPTKPEDVLSRYIELKTSRTIVSQRQKHNFDRHKLLKFWAQSYLIGVPRIVCGFRDDQGRIESLETFKTKEIPTMAPEISGLWKPEVCLNFANHVLQWIRLVVKEDDPTVTYFIEWKKPWTQLTITRERKYKAFLTQRFIDGETSSKCGGRRVRKTCH